MMGVADGTLSLHQGLAIRPLPTLSAQAQIEGKYLVFSAALMVKIPSHQRK